MKTASQSRTEKPEAKSNPDAGLVYVGTRMTPAEAEDLDDAGEWVGLRKRSDIVAVALAKWKRGLRR